MDDRHLRGTIKAAEEIGRRTDNLTAEMKALEAEKAELRNELSALAEEMCEASCPETSGVDSSECDAIKAELAMKRLQLTMRSVSSALSEKIEGEATYTEQTALDLDACMRKIERDMLKRVPRLPRLDASEFVVAATIGVVASLYDMLLIGTPQKGNALKTGSPVTDLLRKLGRDGANQSSPLIKQLERNAKVPYDNISYADGLYPKNHRLHSIGHDFSFLGMAIALMDIHNGTSTIITADGAVLVKAVASDLGDSRTLDSVVRYLTHLLSDVFTPAGLPVPGWVLTQFAASEAESGISLARIAEEMYMDGYDLRHLVAMSSSVGIQKLLLNIYFLLQGEAPSGSPKAVSDSEYDAMQHQLKKKEMAFVVSAVATSGNVIKFLGAGGNPATLNLPQWLAFISDSFAIAKAALRDRTPEIAIVNRRTISAQWDELRDTVDPHAD